MLLVLILVWLNLQLINREACSLTSSMHIYTAEFDQHHACMQVKYLQIFFSLNIFKYFPALSEDRRRPRTPSCHPATARPDSQRGGSNNQATWTWLCLPVSEGWINNKPNMIMMTIMVVLTIIGAFDHGGYLRPALVLASCCWSWCRGPVDGFLHGSTVQHVTH